MAAAQVDFAVLFREHYPRIYRYVRYRVNDDATAEDLTAEIFERAYRARATYDPTRAAFSTWIGRIAHNHVTNHFASQGRRTQHETDLGEAERFAATELPPESQIIKHESLQRLADCLKRLPERERLIIALRFGAEQRNKDIADQVGLKEHSVSVILLRALERLRGCQEGL